MHALTDLKKSNNPWVGVFLTKPDVDIHDETTIDYDMLYRTGSMAHLQNIAPTADGLQVMLMGHRRVRITDMMSQGPPLHVKVAHIENPRDTNGSSSTIKAYTNEILATIRDIIKISPMVRISGRPLWPAPAATCDPCMCCSVLHSSKNTCSTSCRQWICKTPGD